MPEGTDRKEGMPFYLGAFLAVALEWCAQARNAVLQTQTLQALETRVTALEEEKKTLECQNKAYQSTLKQAQEAKEKAEKQLAEAMGFQADFYTQEVALQVQLTGLQDLVKADAEVQKDLKDRCYEFFRISQCSSAKEMWDTLEVTHEGTNDVKRARKHTRIQEYEMFRMRKGESIAEVQKRFTHIINHLMSLGKTFDKEELNIKILKCLDISWQPKVTTIFESKDLASLTMASLFGKLREHELEMNKLNVQESEDKHVRSIALKDAKHKSKQDSSDESE
ncbi:uncharacterized protein [Phaseolus vulgaris]|uniref:uncharacterized protein n=1 Tax=Phaseolus vulgaris TaxID=3885 RepID=UPI0035CAAE2B